MLIENAVLYKKSTLFTKSHVQKYFPSYFIVRIVIVNVVYYIELHLNTQVHQNVGVCEVSHYLPTGLFEIWRENCDTHFN